MSKILVEVAVDTVCPWCFMGKRRLEKAIAEVGPELGFEFEVVFKPYFLNTSPPKEPVVRSEYYIAKFGEEAFGKMVEFMSKLGEVEGIAFKYGGLTGNTRDSHRMIQYALAEGGPEVQCAVVENIFVAYFELERNITDIDMLVEAAATAGLDATKAKAYMESDAGSEEVDTTISRFARVHRLDGVPHYVFSDEDGPKISLSGAHEPHEFVDALRKYKVKYNK